MFLSLILKQYNVSTLFSDACTRVFSFSGFTHCNICSHCVIRNLRIKWWNQEVTLVQYLHVKLKKKPDQSDQFCHQLSGKKAGFPQVQHLCSVSLPWQYARPTASQWLFVYGYDTGNFNIICRVFSSCASKGRDVTLALNVPIVPDCFSFFFYPPEGHNVAASSELLHRVQYKQAQALCTRS